MGLFQQFENLFLWLAGLIVGACLWVSRNIITDRKRIDLLEQQGEHHAQLRREDHEAIKEVRDGVNDIKDHLMKVK